MQRPNVTSAPVRTAEELTAKYDRPRARAAGYTRIAVLPRDGIISGTEAGIRPNEADPRAPFVRDLSGLPASEFRKVRLESWVAVAYLYSRYPKLFERFDSGRGHFKLWQGLFKMSGKIDRKELRAAGGIEELIREVRATITDPRDLELLSKLHLLADRGANDQLRDAALRAAEDARGVGEDAGQVG